MDRRGFFRYVRLRLTRPGEICRDPGRAMSLEQLETADPTVVGALVPSWSATAAPAWEGTRLRLRRRLGTALQVELQPLELAVTRAIDGARPLRELAQADPLAYRRCAPLLRTLVRAGVLSLVPPRTRAGA
jgi:hypothetical protein